MLKQLMLAKKIEQAREILNGYVEEEENLQTRSEELELAIDEAKTDEEIAAVEEEVKKLEEDKTELLEKKSKLEGEIAELEGELEELKAKEPNNDKRGENNMDKLETREQIQEYVRTKGQIREGFKVVDGGVLVPEEILSPYRKPEDVIDLSKLVNIAKVNTGSGTYPIIKKSDGRMVSVAELEKNPELAKPKIEDIPFKIETYRGYIAVSQEVIDDANFDVTGLIAEDIAGQELNTMNDAIAAVLKTATPKAVTGLDGLKKVFNVDLKRVYNAKAVISASLYNELDTTKDENGRYLLQDDITVESGKRLFGKEVVILDDEVIGTNAGDLVGFIGDPKAFATLFDRKRTSVKWVDHEIYGQLLAGYVRFDVKAIDEDAGFYVTYTPETPEA